MILGRAVDVLQIFVALLKQLRGVGIIDCAGAGRVFRARIGLPDWNNVLAMPGRDFQEDNQNNHKQYRFLTG